MTEILKNSPETSKLQELQEVKKETREDLQDLKIQVTFESLLKKDDNSAEKFFDTLTQQKQSELIDIYGEAITIDGKKTSMKGMILGDIVGSAIYFKDSNNNLIKDTRLSNEDIMGITETLYDFSDFGKFDIHILPTSNKQGVGEWQKLDKDIKLHYQKSGGRDMMSWANAMLWQYFMTNSEKEAYTPEENKLFDERKKTLKYGEVIYTGLTKLNGQYYEVSTDGGIDLLPVKNASKKLEQARKELIKEVVEPILQANIDYYVKHPEECNENFRAYVEDQTRSGKLALNITAFEESLAKIEGDKLEKIASK